MVCKKAGDLKKQTQKQLILLCKRSGGSGVLVNRVKMVAPHQLQKFSSNINVFLWSAATEQRSINAIIQQKLDQNIWVSIKESDETNNRAINAVSSNRVLQVLLRWYLFDKDKYKERVSLDCLLTALRYDKYISKNAVKYVKEDQVREGSHKLLR